MTRQFTSEESGMTSSHSPKQKKWFSNLLPWSVLILTAVAVGITFPIQEVFSNASYLVANAYFGVSISLCCLFGIWLGLCSSIWRFLLCLPLAVLASISPAYIDGPFHWSEFLLPFLTTLVLFFTFEFAKFFFSLKLVQQENSSFGRFQFGISKLMVATTVIALLISLFNFTDRLSEWGQFPVEDLAAIICYFVFAALINSWAVLMLKKVWFATVAIPMTLLAFVCMMSFVGESVQDWTYYSLPFAVCWAVILAQLLVLRMNGLRIACVNE